MARSPVRTRWPNWWLCICIVWERPGAAIVTFVSDGAVWIWDRVERIASQAGIPKTVPVYEILDHGHATHHVSLALASLGVSKEERMPLYRDLRRWLRDGQLKRVVRELEQLADDDAEANAEFQTELSYLKRHGAAGRLKYATFRGWGFRLAVVRLKAAFAG